MRTLLFVVLSATYAYAWSQAAPFTIIRPAEGARVREVVKIHIPKNSVPSGGYISVALDGNFIEATLPQVKGNVYEYLLDTKKSKIADGKHVVEVTLYGPTGGHTGILDKSKVNIIVANKEQIKEPSNGARLRYKFRAGSRWEYDVKATLAVLSISEGEEKAGATAAEQLLQDDEFGVSYAIDNVHPDGNGIVRMEGIPDAKGYVVFEQLNGGMDVVNETQLLPVYMEMTPVGDEFFARYNAWVDPSGGAPTMSGYVVGAYLPVLPPEREKVGDKWSARPKFTVEYHGAVGGMTTYLPLAGVSILASGQLVGYEWEQGHPCAHIHYEFAYGRGSASAKKQMSIHGSLVDDAQYSMQQEVWFATDLGTVVRSDGTLTVEGSAAGISAAVGGATGGGSGTPTSVGGGGPPSPTSAGPSPSGGPGAPPYGSSPGRGPRGRGGPGRAPAGEGAGGPGPAGGATMGSSGGGGAPAAGTGESGRVRLRLRMDMVLRQ